MPDQRRPVPLGKGCPWEEAPAVPCPPSPLPHPQCYECVLFERLRFGKRIGLVLCDSSTLRIAVSGEGGHWVTVRVGVRVGQVGMGLGLWQCSTRLGPPCGRRGQREGGQQESPGLGS